MKTIRLIGLAAALLCLASVANAATRSTPCDPATPDNAVCLTGTPPTLNTDGTAITVPLTFRVEQKVGASAYATVATGLTTLQYYAKNLAPGDYTWRVYANCVGIPNVVTCNEGPASNAMATAREAADPEEGQLCRASPDVHRNDGGARALG